MRLICATTLLFVLATTSVLSAQRLSRTPDVSPATQSAASALTSAAAVRQALALAEARLAYAQAVLPNALASIEPALASAHATLSVLPAPLASIEPALASAHAALAVLPAQLAEIPLLDQETAEVAYRQAREELNRDNYRRAADLFARLIDRYPRSSYAGDSYFWQAFALSRLSGSDNLQRARDLLETQKRSYPQASTRSQGDDLLVRIQTELARSGDANAAENLARTANRVLQEQECPRREDESLRTAALNALLQMDAQNAMPVLKQIMAKKDACSAPLRRRAVMLVSQQRTSEKEDILLDAARNDPDREVRQQAVFWLGQVNSDKALSAIESILSGSDDPQVQERAIMALSQHRSARAGEIMRAWAESNDRPARLRDRAIFWLGQHRDPANGVFLRNLYAKLPSGNLKERVLFALSQRRGEGNEAWLMQVATDEKEDIEVRKRALFWAGQMRGVGIAELIGLYDRMTSTEMKEQLIFVYSQRREREAVDKMMDIVRKEQNRRLRDRAIFWLGQSKDPRAVQFILDIIG
jgi:HEAT repeat protein